MSKRKRAKESRLVSHLLRCHLRVRKRLNSFQSVLRNLYSEGLVSMGKNLKAGKETLDLFEEEIVRHMALEEQVIFPYLERHIPRLCAAIGYIRREHMEFRAKLRRFRNLLTKVCRSKNSHARVSIIRRIKWVGTYIICHLDYHIKLENASVYKAIDRELSGAERNDLVEKIGGRLKGRRGLKNEHIFSKPSFLSKKLTSVRHLR